MTVSALRTIACAGVLATGLLLGAPAVVVTAEPAGDSTDSGGVDGASAPPADDPASEGGGSASVAGGGTDDGTHPTSTIGNGRNDVVDPNAGIEGGEATGTGTSRPSPKYRPLLIPILRIPTLEEFAEPGWTPPSAYFTTLEVPIISLSDVMRALVPPKPKPTPRPAFRTQQEEPPVIDAASGGGSDYAATAGGPRPLEIPLVGAPRMPMGEASPLGPVGAAPQGAPSSTGGQPVVVGARTPSIRGSVPATESVTTAGTVTQASGQATRGGYPRYLRTSTVAELSMVALPGAAGLLLFTFGGGVIGYRQANSARFIRAGAARFLEE